MHASLVAAALLGLSASADAAAFKMPKRTFTIDRVHNEKFAGYHGPRELLKAYRKYGIPIPEGLLNTVKTHEAAVAAGAAGSGGIIHANTGGRISAAAKNNGTAQTGTVTATPTDQDAEYLCPVSIGGQTLNLDFDTGSSDLWIFNTGLPAAQQSGHKVYDPTKSTTYKKIDGASWKIQYGDGSSASGTVGTDVVNVGGASVEKQAIELATQLSSSFSSGNPNDGLLGLAFSSINTVTPQKQQTFFANVQSSLAEPLFAANLRKGEPGSYTFGTVDQTKYSGDLTWVEIDNSQGFWQFNSGSSPAIADTGTTLLLAVDDIVSAYYKNVQGATNNQQAGGYTFPCSAKLNDLTLAIGPSYKAKIEAEFLNFGPIQQGSSTCFGGLQSSGQLGQGVYGDVMFKSQYVVFNGGNNTLGFATHV